MVATQSRVLARRRPVCGFAQIPTDRATKRPNNLATERPCIYIYIYNYCFIAGLFLKDNQLLSISPRGGEPWAAKSPQ